MKYIAGWDAAGIAMRLFRALAFVLLAYSAFWVAAYRGLWYDAHVFARSSPAFEFSAGDFHLSGVTGNVHGTVACTLERFVLLLECPGIRCCICRRARLVTKRRTFIELNMQRWVQRRLLGTSTVLIDRSIMEPYCCMDLYRAHIIVQEKTCRETLVVALHCSSPPSCTRRVPCVLWSQREKYTRAKLVYADSVHVFRESAMISLQQYTV